MCICVWHLMHHDSLLSCMMRQQSSYVASSRSCIIIILSSSSSSSCLSSFYVSQPFCKQGLLSWWCCVCVLHASLILNPVCSLNYPDKERVSQKDPMPTMMMTAQFLHDDGSSFIVVVVINHFFPWWWHYFMQLYDWLYSSIDGLSTCIYNGEWSQSKNGWTLAVASFFFVPFVAINQEHAIEYVCLIALYQCTTPSRTDDIHYKWRLSLKDQSVIND